MRLRYETWRRIHNVGGFLLLALAFLHSLALGADFENNAARVVWVALPALAWSAWFYGRLARPRLLERNLYRVVSIASEVPRVWTLTLEAPVNRPLLYAPGQFQFLRLHGSWVSAEEHPFSIASSPSPEGLISLTIKEIGDFTSTVGRIKPGDRAAVHGPFGRFSHVFHAKDDDLVFVAAGIGITPFMSMLRYMRDRRDSRRVLLVYANRGATDITFRSELESIESGAFPALKTIHILSRPPDDWVGPIGRLDTECLRSLCGGLRVGLDKLRTQLRRNVRELSPSEYLEAKRFLDHFDDAVTALRQTDVGNRLASRYPLKARTVEELIKDMTAKGLQFAPALPDDREAYTVLHQALATYSASGQVQTATHKLP
jgi:predicted ferric reductase